MTTNQPDRLDRMEALLENFIAASASDRASSNERMISLEQTMERQNQASNERMTRLEEAMERQTEESNKRMTGIEQAVASNNKFLEAFSADLRGYTNTLHNFISRIDGVIATSNQDRDEIKTQLNAIRRQVTKGNQPQP